MKKESNSADDFSYKVENDGIAITGYKGEIKYVVIPSEIDGLPVVAIGNSAFMEKNLINVVIPNSVKTIEGDAFAYNKLTDIVIPDSVEIIGKWAFYYNELSKVVILGSVKIDTAAFMNNPLPESNVEIHGSNVIIGIDAFSCDDITFARYQPRASLDYWS